MQVESDFSRAKCLHDGSFNNDHQQLDFWRETLSLSWVCEGYNALCLLHTSTFYCIWYPVQQGCVIQLCAMIFSYATITKPGSTLCEGQSLGGVLFRIWYWPFEKRRKNRERRSSTSFHSFASLLWRAIILINAVSQSKKLGKRLVGGWTITYIVPCQR